MLTLKQCKVNSYAISVVMNSHLPIKQAVSSINDICDLNVTEYDIKKLIRLRVRYFCIDRLFSQWDLN